MSTILFANNAQSTLASPISSSATTANLSPGTGALFPQPTGAQYFTMTFVDAATKLVNEIVYVTNVTSDTITMIRGQEGTTAKSWSSGDIAANLNTAGTMTALAQLDSPTFTGTPRAPTPSEFDNSTKLATTAFVKQASIYSTCNQINSFPVTLTSAYVSELNILGSSGGNVALPLASSVPIGATLTLISQGGSSLISPQGGDTLSNGTTIVSGITLRGVNSIQITAYDAATWIVSGGSAFFGSLGVGQLLSDVTSTRLVATTYTNSTNYTKFVMASILSTAPNVQAEGFLTAYNGTSYRIVGSSAQTSNASMSIYFPVPAGGTYQVNVNVGTGSVYQWIELG